MFVILFLLYAGASAPTLKRFDPINNFSTFASIFFIFLLPFSWCPSFDLISTQYIVLDQFIAIVFAIFPDLFVTY